MASLPAISAFFLKYLFWLIPSNIFILYINFYNKDSNLLNQVIIR